MDLTETPLTGEYAFEGKLLRLRVDTARMPDGSTATREVVHHPGGVGIVPLTEDRRVLMVRQFRYPYLEETTEIPAGKRDPGEDPLTTGTRELEEEVGMRADRMIPLGTVYPSPGYTDEVIYLYLAVGLHPTACHPDEDEFLAPVSIPLTQAVEQVLDGTLPDAKTQIGILKAEAYLRQTEG